MVGIWGKKKNFGKLTSKVQIRLRENRDRIILKKALVEYRDHNPQGKGNPDAKDLIKEDFLESESSPFFYRYNTSLLDASDHVLKAIDLESSEYSQEFKGHLIQYLAPKMTINDYRYRVQSQNMDEEEFYSNRYRMAVTYMDDILWVSNDIYQLEKLIDRISGAGLSLSDNQKLLGGLAGNWDDQDKMQILVDLERVSDLGLLAGINSPREDELSILDPLRKLGLISGSNKGEPSILDIIRYLQLHFGFQLIYKPSLKGENFEFSASLVLGNGMGKSEK